MRAARRCSCRGRRAIHSRRVCCRSRSPRRVWTCSTRRGRWRAGGRLRRVCRSIPLRCWSMMGRVLDTVRMLLQADSSHDCDTSYTTRSIHRLYMYLFYIYPFLCFIHIAVRNVVPSFCTRNRLDKLFCKELLPCCKVRIPARFIQVRHMSSSLD